MKKQPIFGITYINDRPWIVTLPDGGNTREEAGQSEFAHFTEQVGKEALHCTMSSWCSNQASVARWDEEGEGFFWREDGHVCHTDGSPDSWDVRRSNSRNYSTGFRPVLIPVDPETLQPDSTRLQSLKDGTTIRMGTLYMDDIPLTNPTDPIGCGEPQFGMFGPPVGNVPRHSKNATLRIGNTHTDPNKQINFIKLGDRLVSDRVILGCVSMEDLESQLKLEPCIPARTETEKRPDGPIELWGRLGFALTVTPQELDALRVNETNAKDLLIQLIRSERCVIYGDTYFPEAANEEYLTEDINFDLPELPLRTSNSKQADLEQGRESQKLDRVLSDAQTRSTAGQPVQETTPPKTPEH